MWDLLAQILDEAWHGLNSGDNISAKWHLESILELIEEYDGFQEANLIPKEMRAV